MKLVTQNEKIWLDKNATSIISVQGSIVTANVAADVTILTDNSGGATADGTIGIVTAPTALTNNTGGTPSSTLAAIANTAPADLTAQGVVNGIISNALSSIATTETANRVAIVALTDAIKELSTKLNAIRNSLVAAGIML